MYCHNTSGSYNTTQDGNCIKQAENTFEMLHISNYSNEEHPIFTHCVNIHKHFEIIAQIQFNDMLYNVSPHNLSFQNYNRY